MSLPFIVPSVCPPHHSSSPVFVGMTVCCRCLLSRLYLWFIIPTFILLTIFHPCCLSSPIHGYHHCQHLQFPLWAVAHRWVGGACDVAMVVADVGMVVVGLAGSCHCRVWTEPIAALRAEAHSSSVGWHLWLSRNMPIAALQAAAHSGSMGLGCVILMSGQCCNQMIRT